MWASANWGLSTILILIPLMLITVIACTLGTEKSWVSLSNSPLANWRSSSSLSIFTNSNNYNEQKNQSLSSIVGGVDDHVLFQHKLATKNPSEEEEEKGEIMQLESTNESPAANTKTQIIKRFSKLEKLEAGLVKARSAIKEAARNKNNTSIHEDPDYVPQGSVYRNANGFHRSYLEMEKLFKIYVYKEGEPPIFHSGPCKSIYSTEGRFIHEMEKENLYRTQDPDDALLYFLPFSVVMMVQYVYDRSAREFQSIGNTLADYIHMISDRYPFWNRSLGADHFMVSCHDWAPHTSSYVPHLFNNSIRVLCNANTSEGFNPSKDVPLPEIHLRTGEITELGGLPPPQRSLLAFFAGGLHGDIRYILLEHWKGKDSDVQVYEKLPENISYDGMLKKSKFCLCPSGYEVASPRVVEAIYAECIPVLISDGYVPPLSDVLNWNTFSVQVEVKDIPNIKKILMSIPQDQYLRMRKRVKQIQRHFVVNAIPKRFDFFHMTVHSVWLRRLNVRIQD